MNSLMTNECGVVPKAFPTVTALKRPFPSVDSLVLDKVKLSNESHPTFAALIRPHTHVDFLVLSKCLFSTEGLPTLSALVIALSTADDLPALRVSVWLPHTVQGQLLEGACAAMELLPVSAACPGPLCRVLAAVAQE